MLGTFGKTTRQVMRFPVKSVKRVTTFLRTIMYKVKTFTFRNHQFDPHRKLRTCEQ
jgi:hypothetical protein